MANLSNINNILRTNSTGVGIFADAGSYPLEISSTTTAGVKLINTGNATYDIYANASEEFIIAKNGVGNRLVINSGGDVIIGGGSINTPSTNANSLVIDNGSGVENGMTINSSVASSIRFGDAASNSVGSLEYNHQTDYMRMIVNSAERMRIDSAGDVTIQTSGADDIKNLTINSSNGSSQVAGFIIQNDGANGYVHFKAGSGNATPTTRLTIGNAANTGNVGIGTPSPADKLTVNGNIITQGGSTNTGYDRYLKLYGNTAPATNTHRWAGLAVYNNGGNNVNELAFFTGSGDFARTEKMRITSGGNVLIGTTSAENPRGLAKVLEIEAGDACGIILNDSRDSHPMGIENAGAVMNFTYNTSPLMTILTAGNVGIGTTSPGYKLVVAQSDVTEPSGIDANTSILIKNNTWSGITMISTEATGNFITFGDDASGFAGRIQYSHVNNAMVFETAGAEKLRVNSSAQSLRIQGGSVTGSNYMQFVNSAGTSQGYFGYGGASNILYIVQQVVGDIAFYTGGAVRGSINTGGTLTMGGDVIAYGSPSDKRLKENIKPIESALDKVIKLQGVTFDWKDKKEEIDQFGKAYKLQEWKNDIGFIAQDVQKVIPELVRENSDGMLSMRHQGIAPILLEAIKELKAEIEELKNKPCNCNCK